MLLPPDKFAVILLDVTLNCVLQEMNRPVTVVSLVCALGDAVEVNLSIVLLI